MRVVICIRRPHFHKWTKCLGHGTFLICIILLPWHQKARRSPGIEFLANFDLMLFFRHFPKNIFWYCTQQCLHCIFCSIIAQRLTIITLVSSIILTAIGWETKTGISLSLFLMLIPLESMFMSLVWNLGKTLGGTITGYAIVAPVVPHK